MNSCGVYVHIPFCSSKCYYCDFYSRICNNAVRQQYLTTLIEQIKAVKPLGYRAKTVYIGGGTPSVLGKEGIQSLFEAIYGSIDVEKNAEITVEVNPESVTADFVEGLISCHVNRVSMGVQSFVDSELSALGRKTDSVQCENAFHLLRKNGIENISIDLMLATPGQTAQSLLYSLEKAVCLSPEHISAYLLKVEKNTVFEKKGICEASDEVQSELYLQTSHFLCEHGYEHYEVSNFARQGFRSRHNMLYWTMEPYLAFGAGAHGFDGKTRYFYASDLNDFSEKITEEVLDEATIKQESVMLGLRTSDGVVLDESRKKYAENLIENGYMHKCAERYSLTPKGFLVSNKIIADIL